MNTRCQVLRTGTWTEDDSSDGFVNRPERSVMKMTSRLGCISTEVGCQVAGRLLTSHRGWWDWYIKVHQSTPWETWITMRDMYLAQILHYSTLSRTNLFLSFNPKTSDWFLMRSLSAFLFLPLTTDLIGDVSAISEFLWDCVRSKIRDVLTDARCSRRILLHGASFWRSHFLKFFYHDEKAFTLMDVNCLWKFILKNDSTLMKCGVSGCFQKFLRISCINLSQVKLKSNPCYLQEGKLLSFIRNSNLTRDVIFCDRMFFLIYQALVSQFQL